MGMPDSMSGLRTLILWTVVSTTLANAQCPTGAPPCSRYFAHSNDALRGAFACQPRFCSSTMPTNTFCNLHAL